MLNHTVKKKKNVFNPLNDWQCYRVPVETPSVYKTFAVSWSCTVTSLKPHFISFTVLLLLRRDDEIQTELVKKILVMFLSNFFYRIVFLTRNRYTGDKLAFNIYSVGILQRRVLGIVFFF